MTHLLGWGQKTEELNMGAEESQPDHPNLGTRLYFPQGTRMKWYTLLTSVFAVTRARSPEKRVTWKNARVGFWRGSVFFGSPLETPRGYNV